MMQDLLADLPQLVPIKRKKQDNTQKVAQPSTENNLMAQDMFYNVLTNYLDKSSDPNPDNNNKTIQNSPTIENQSPANKQANRKNRQLQKDTKNSNEQKPSEVSAAQTHNQLNQLIYKQNKGLVQQKIPDSIESINKNIEQLTLQRQQLFEDLQEVEQQLKNNPNNPILERQLTNYNRQIQHLNTTILLYKDKIDMKGNTKELKQIIQKLKQQNMQIKGRVIKGMETIQEYMHYLPCEREKNALIELEKTKKELQKQKKMRQNLELKVKNTIQDFTRVFQQADLARKIITSKLKKLQMTQDQLQNGFDRHNVQASSLPENKHSNINSIQLLPSPHYGFDNSRLSVQIKNKTKEFQAIQKSNDPTIRKMVNREITPKKQMTLQQKMIKMRSNQATFKKMKF